MPLFSLMLMLMMMLLHDIFIILHFLLTLLFSIYIMPLPFSSLFSHCHCHYASCITATDFDYALCHFAARLLSSMIFFTFLSSSP